MILLLFTLYSFIMGTRLIGTQEYLECKCRRIIYKIMETGFESYCTPEYILRLLDSNKRLLCTYLGLQILESCIQPPPATLSAISDTGCLQILSFQVSYSISAVQSGDSNKEI